MYTRKKRGRPCVAPLTAEEKATRKQEIELLLSKIAQRKKATRPENYLSNHFNVSVFAVRQWIVRGIPKAIQAEFAKLAGVPVEVVQAL